MIFLGDANQRCDRTVRSDEREEQGHRPGDRDDVIFRPVVGDETGLSEYREQDRAVHGRAPDPVACYLAVTLNEVPRP